MKKTIIPLLLLLFLTSCEENTIKGDGPIVVQELTLPNFSGIESYGSNTINISYGETPNVLVTGHANIIDNLGKEVLDGVWKIKLKDANYKNAELKFEIVLPKLNSVELNGDGNTYVENFISDKTINIGIYGSSNIYLNGNSGCENLIIDMEGSGKITAVGDFKNLQNSTINIAGSAVYEAFPVISTTSNIYISGSGSCNVSVKKSLNAKINGSGIINYKGQPAITSNISGSGKVVNIN